jgi:hypothetical protein
MKNKFLKLTTVALFISASIYAQESSKIIIPTKHNSSLTLKDIAEVQPGLGTIMVEFGHRFYITYYAAKAQNWGLAKYQLHELIEAQEVAEITRPKYTEQLKEFEDTYLKKLTKAIETKDIKSFEKEYKKTTQACNTCHSKNGHPYIQYQLPKEAPLYLRMQIK